MINETEDVIPLENKEGKQVLPPDIPRSVPDDERYMLLFNKAMDVCKHQRPKFGKGGSGLNVDDFQRLYGTDPFYKWMGIDSPLMYAAHKTASGMTSIYRQIGIGVQWILNEVVQDHMGLTKAEANWTYQVPSTTVGKTRPLSLDTRIEVDKIRNDEAKQRFQQWMGEAFEKLLLPEKQREDIRGVVIEARQGYKSQDGKRQQGDIANASNAYVHSYLPVMVFFSSQVPKVLAERYTRERWLILMGTLEGSTLNSAYVFCRDVVGYDLAGFFERNSRQIQTNMKAVLTALLSP